MRKVLASFRNLLKDRSASMASEYGVLMVLLSLAVIAGVGLVADALETMWFDSSSSIKSGLNTGGR